MLGPMHKTILSTAILFLAACGGPSPAQNRVRIEATKAVVQQNLGTYRPTPSKDTPLESLAIKKTLPRQIAGLMLRSDVGVALDIGDAHAIVVEALYGFNPPNVRVLVLDIATHERLADHAEGDPFEGGELIEHDDAHITYLANGRFLVDVSGNDIKREDLRAGLKAIDLDKLATLSAGR